MLLTSRAPDDILFRRTDRPVSVAQFVAAALALADRLPDRGPLLNLCQDRTLFAVGFAAALLRGHVSLLTSDRSPDRLRGLCADFPSVTALTDLPLELPAGLKRVDCEPEITATAGGAPVPDIPADQLAAIVFTSGSTGRPAGHPKVWGALAARSQAAALAFGFGQSAPAQIVGTVSPQHMYGFETTVLLPLHGAAAAWCGPGFYPLDVLHALQAVPEPRILVTTPHHLRALLQAGHTLPKLAGVISATAPLPEGVAARAEAAWGAPVHEIFGATEVGSIAWRRTTAGDTWTLYDGVSLTEGGAGVRVTAPFAPAQALCDAVELPAPGRMRLLGRQSDMVKLAGKRASLGSLNQILNSIDGVTDGVFIAPDDLDDRPTARLLAYAVAPGLSAEAILAALRQRVEPAFLPRRVMLVDRLPRNDIGKLPRQALLALQAP